jgi:hypothetical protein
MAFDKKTPIGNHKNDSYRPEIVLCNAIDDRHIDHEKEVN